MFCRAAGGFGGPAGPAHEFLSVPIAPDKLTAIATSPDIALLYRLNHDRNALHADTEYAARARFPRPILHGLATYGVAAVAMNREFAGGTLRTIEVRFSKPVYPGETVCVELWEDRGEVQFRARVDERIVLDRGRAVIA